MVVFLLCFIVLPACIFLSLLTQVDTCSIRSSAYISSNTEDIVLLYINVVNTYFLYKIESVSWLLEV